MKIQLKNIILLLAVVLACHLVSTKSVTSSDEKEAIQYINRLYGDYLKHKWTGLKMKHHLNHQQRLIPSKVHKPNIYEYYARRNSKFRRCRYEGSCNPNQHDCCFDCDANSLECLASPGGVDPFP